MVCRPLALVWSLLPASHSPSNNLLGIIASTPRDGSSPKPFEQDTSVIRNKDIASGKTGVCGKTAAGGNNDVAAQLAGLFRLLFCLYPTLNTFS
jgi:hypothetical protein